MDIITLRQIASQHKGVTQDIKWENHLCFNVGEKMFLFTSPDQLPVTASFKTNSEDFDTLCEREGISPAPYMAKHKWVYVNHISRLTKKEWEQYVAISYELVFLKLPMKLKKAISEV